MDDVSMPRPRPAITEDKIVEWARAFFAREGRWPSSLSGRVYEDNSETWGALNFALVRGSRGLPGGCSLPELLRKRTEKRGRTYKRALTYDQVAEWAITHLEKTGGWPSANSGRIKGAKETWSSIDAAFVTQARGLTEYGSLSKFLNAAFGPRIRKNSKPQLRQTQIAAWARNHRRGTGQWPSSLSGRIPESDGDTWMQVDTALRLGQRGLPGGISLSRLLEKTYGRKPGKQRRQFADRDIINWAKAFHHRHGRWPTDSDKVQVKGAPLGVTWGTVQNVLARDVAEGRRKLSLAMLLRQHRGIPLPGKLPSVDDKQVLAWARAFHAATGKWPSGLTRKWDRMPVSWVRIDEAMKKGRVRGVKPGKSLYHFLCDHRGVAYRHMPKITLTVSQVLRWARAHHDRTGSWPGLNSGPVVGGPRGLTWRMLNAGLHAGRYGLPSGAYLGEFLIRNLGIRHPRHNPDITLDQVRKWAVAHHERTGRWPSSKRRDPIPESPGDNWERIRVALRDGYRGLPRMTLTEALRPVRADDWLEARRPPLEIDRILLWAKAHARRTGEWPDKGTGRVTDEKTETWYGINEALRLGKRGLTGSTTLTALLSEAPMPRQRIQSGGSHYRVR